MLLSLNVQELVTLAIPAVGVLVWLLRLESKVNTNAAIQREIHDDVKYLRRRMDKLLNGD